MNLDVLQREQAAWALRNFGPREERSPHHPLLGAVEEVGELAHAQLKYEQGIRNLADHDKFLMFAADAVGDIIVYLADYCTLNGLNLAEVVRQTWNEVSKRDWKANPTGEGYGNPQSENVT